MGTAFVGMVNNAAAFGVLTDDPHAEGGEDGEECEDEDGGHGGDSKRELGLVFIKSCFLCYLSSSFSQPTGSNASPMRKT